MPALAELRQIFTEQIALHDPRPTVRQEALDRKGVIEGMKVLLAGEPKAIFDTEMPIYSGLVWDGPTHISVFPTPRGFDLTVRAESGYGRKVIVERAIIILIDLTSKGDTPVINHALAVSPWAVAHQFVERVVMATSQDPVVQQQYQVIRAQEQENYERLAKLSLEDDYL